jgi:hypothetical protein
MNMEGRLRCLEARTRRLTTELFLVAGVALPGARGCK